MTTPFHIQPPYYGAAYYPENWPPEQVAAEIPLMKEAGMNVMRMAEFAWAKMEPAENEFDFDWLHRVVDELGEAGIASILGTPGATPPAWLTESYPEVCFVSPQGEVIGHGGRRHVCPNSPKYRELCLRITTKMAQEFGNNPQVLGWQIDNEVMPHYGHNPPNCNFTRSCCCPVCKVKFATFLEQRFGTIGALNDAWSLNLWSQKYDRFDQVPHPDPRIWHHPSLLAAWDAFSSASWVDFVRCHAEVLHEHATQPVGTDMMPFHNVDLYDVNEALDVVEFNHYHFDEAFRDAVPWFDFLRPIKETPFWNTETSTSWGGSTQASPGTPPGFCRANSWLPIALGGEANLFWLWRTHWAGQEIMFGSVITSQGRKRHNFEEIADIGAQFATCRDFLNSTHPAPSGLALHFGADAFRLFHNQPIVEGFDYSDAFLRDVYHPLIKVQYRPDVIDARVDLDAYRLIVTPFYPNLDDHGLRARLHAWIEAGGIWVAGPWTDNRTPEGSQFTNSPFGSLEEWAGVYCKYQLPGNPRALNALWQDGEFFKNSLWSDGFELRGAEALATYTERELQGLAAITRHRMGKGAIYLLGTMPEETAWRRLIRQAAEEAGIAPVATASENVLCVPRQGGDQEGIILVELDQQPGHCELPRPGVNLLTGNIVSGRIDLEPYGVAVVVYA